jgi:hypothetical protein
MITNIIERQIDSDGYIEDSFRLDSAQGMLLYNELAQKTPQYLTLIHDIELISTHAADGISYKEDSICLVYNVLPNDQLIRQFCLDNTRLIDFYVAKIALSSQQVHYKFYYNYLDSQLAWIQQKIQSLSNSWPAVEFGVSYTPLTQLEDYYFYTADIEAVYALFGFQEPQESKQWHNVKNAHYAITVDASTKTVLKLKRYVHPALDLQLKDWKKIYGITNA